MLVAVLDRIFSLDLLLGKLNHLTAVCSDGGRNGETWQLADSGTREAVNGVGTDLVWLVVRCIFDVPSTPVGDHPERRA